MINDTARRPPPAARRPPPAEESVLAFPRDHRGADLSDIELVEPGHKPVLAWRFPGLPG